MSKAKNEKSRREEFERQLGEAIEKDKATSDEDYQAWLDNLPEHVPPPTGDGVMVIFMGAGKSINSKLESQ